MTELFVDDADDLWVLAVEGVEIDPKIVFTVSSNFPAAIKSCNAL